MCNVVYPELEREQFMEKFLVLAKKSVTFACLDQDGNLVGYGHMRPATDGYRLGPIGANSVDIAEFIYRNLAVYVPDNDANLYTDVIGANTWIMEMLAKLDMKMVFPCARMCTGPHPETYTMKNVAVASWELSF
jgi:hypothetical protein